MGSPFYYDVLFDDAPGDVVFHDCMWSGICTCCMQLLHTDSYYQFANESPDLKVEELNCRTTNHQILDINVDTEKNHHHHQQQQHQQQNQLQSATHHQQQPLQQSNNANSKLFNQQSISSLATTQTLCTASNPSPKMEVLSPSEHRQQELIQYVDQTSSSSSSSSTSSLSPSGNSPKPIRRREHNDSERKRRDHLRNAFNFLRDQVPRFKSNNKKPPRIQILHEATNYIQAIIKESDELERRMNEERAKHERLKSI